MELFQNNIYFIALSFLVFLGAKKFQKWTGQLWVNPILITIVVLIVFLQVTGISYETYSMAGDMINFWMKPAIVALGVPLYLQMKKIRQQLIPILVSQLIGCVIGIVSVVLVAKALGASREVIVSLAPKSVTTPIAMEVSAKMGGIPSLTAAIVMAVGLLGAICGFKVLEIGRIHREESQGISLGTASHALGTSRAMEKGQSYGVFASLGLILNGVLTAILTPLILELLGV